jgi:DNA ligase D-like protein (predicted 3'-phosphoesterase)
MKRFVVHEHFAKRHHYDLRLEYNGVLKSWAIPKEISYVSTDKRLAVEVEDHPLDYIDFIGEIPEGQYGAGQVEIWDSGKYYFIEGDLNKGKVLIRFKGSKLDGFWKLYKAKFINDESWLIQRKD